MMLHVQAIMCRRQDDDAATLLLVKSSPFDVVRKKESKSTVPCERLVRSHGRMGLFFAIIAGAYCHGRVRGVEQCRKNEKKKEKKKGKFRKSR